MMKRKLFQRLLIMSVVGTITISSAIVVFADNGKVTNSGKPKVEGKLGGHRKGENFKSDMQKKYMKKKDTKKGNHLVGILATEVKAGVITQAESDKVTAFIKAKQATKKAERDAQRAKLEAMSVEERAAYMKANRPNHGNIFAELVTAGILTQAKADKVQAVVPQKTEKRMGYGRP